LSRFLLAIACISLLSQELPLPTAKPPAPLTPSPSPSPDPAAAVFTTPVGVILVAVQPEKTADYEAAIVALRDALQRTDDPTRRAVAAGWRVYRAAETDAKKNVLYVHALAPAVPAVDYRPSLLLDELLQGAPADLLAKYRDSFAGPATKLSLTELAHMGVAAVAKD